MRNAVFSLSILALFAASCTIATPIPPQVVTVDDPEPRSVMLSEMCTQMGWTYQSGPGAYQYRATGPRGDLVTFNIGKDLMTINDTRWRQERDVVEIKNKDLMIPESTFNFVVKHFGMHHLVRGQRRASTVEYELPPIAPGAAPAHTPAKATSNSLRGLTICIDPGHGGEQLGGDAHGLSEKTIVLLVSLRLRELCEAAGARVVMTRVTDIDLSLDRRCEIANTCGCDLFLSVHANIAPGNDPVTGFEAFYNPVSTNGARFAKNLCDAIDAVTDAPNRGAKRDPRGLRVLEKTKMPAVLFELGFLSNRAEGRRLNNPDYQKALAKGLLDGIVATWRQKASVSR